MLLVCEKVGLCSWKSWAAMLADSLERNLYDVVSSGLEQRHIKREVIT